MGNAFPSNPFFSPFIVPVAGCFMILGIIVAKIYSDMRSKELRSQERIAMVNRGVPLEEINRMSARSSQEEKKVRDPLRSLANTRRAATVILSSGVGLAVFGLLLFAVIPIRPVLIVAATGVLNLAIGAGFLIDYSMQKRELARFGMEVDAE